jgi:hypothetical protein
VQTRQMSWQISGGGFVTLACSSRRRGWPEMRIRNQNKCSCLESTYAVRSFFGVNVDSSSSSGGQRFFLGETRREVYRSDMGNTGSCLRKGSDAWRWVSQASVVVLIRREVRVRVALFTRRAPKKVCSKETNVGRSVSVHCSSQLPCRPNLSCSAPRPSALLCPLRLSQKSHSPMNAHSYHGCISLSFLADSRSVY